ncbi:MAG: YceI family protein [Flavobacteriales bacterium]|nr:YceI family protein [Flavobacteriales bacterium]
MKKLIQPIFGLAIAAMMIACGGAEKKAEATEVKEEMIEEEVVAKTMTINLDDSKVIWTGSIIGGYSHNGTLAISEGSIDMAGDDITGGSFTIDMSTITPTDSNYSEDHSSDMLIGHLSTGDFFLVDSFPTATFVIKSSDLAAGTITGDLTVKGTTKEETINEVSIDLASGVATGKLTFNRQDYDVTYVSSMKDMVLSDDIELSISLKM